MNNLALNLASQNKLDQAIDMQRAKEISPGIVEIERNLHIVSTLQRRRGRFHRKQTASGLRYGKARTEGTRRSSGRRTASEKEVTVTETKKQPAEKEKPAGKVVREDIDNKQLTPAKKAAPAPEKVEPAASSKANVRGSKQNFN